MAFLSSIFGFLDASGKQLLQMKSPQPTNKKKKILKV